MHDMMGVILGHGRVRAACWKKVTIEHDAIPNLNMDGMTMVFPPPTRTFEDNQGQRVRFTADRTSGELTLRSIQKSK